jgi:hypothetical protein
LVELTPVMKELGVKIMELELYPEEYVAHRSTAENDYEVQTTLIESDNKAMEWLDARNYMLSAENQNLLQTIIEKNAGATLHLEIDYDVVYVLVYKIIAY